ncbi:MAG: hypothetical protein ABIH11_03870 [Candidatus Altiarchaeota archaeon]
MVRSKAPIPSDYMGITVPMKEVLGVGAFIGDCRPDVDAVLKKQALDLMQNVFGTKTPESGDILGKIEDGTLKDFRRKYRDRYWSEGREVMLLGEAHLYFRTLAYHHYIKRDTLRIASKHRVVISTSPLSDIEQYPYETLIVESGKGGKSVEKTIDGFFDELDEHMRKKYGIEIQRPEDITHEKARKHVGFQINNPQSLMSRPVNFNLCLERQTPPDTDDVRQMRQWFNDFMRDTAQTKQHVVEELLKGDIVSEINMQTIPGLPPIIGKITSTGRGRASPWLEDRI